MVFSSIQGTTASYNSLRKYCLGLLNYVLILVTVVSSRSVYSASFDCEKASTNIEIMICNNKDLSKSDEILSQRYKLALTLTNSSEKIVSIQKHWLYSVRNKCNDVGCLMAAYRDRTAALDPSLLVPRGINKPIQIDELGENWKYKKDEDKVSIIRDVMKRNILVPYNKNSNEFELCKDFRRDFIEGGLEVIEPELQVLYSNDPRLNVPMSKNKNNESNFNSKINWHHCDKFDTTDSDYENPYGYFYGLSVIGLPPYRFYNITLNKSKNVELQNVLLYRELGNGYSQDYAVIDQNACEIKDNIQVFSPKSYTSLNSHDALSLLIRYQGKSVVLAYLDYAKIGENKPIPSISIESFSPHQACSWMDPSLASHQ